MTQWFRIKAKLTPASDLYGNPEWDQEPQWVRDASGEVREFQSIESAIDEAMELQDRTDRVSYTVEAA